MTVCDAHRGLSQILLPVNEMGQFRGPDEATEKNLH